MREDVVNTLSRWLLALAVIFIPLSLIVLITVSFAYNFPDRQWTRYLLFSSWLVLGLSLLAGMANLVNLSFEVDYEDKESPKAEIELETDEEGEVVEVLTDSKGVDMGAVLMLSQAFTFALGFILYVIFICWMIVPSLQLQTTTGF